MSPRAAWRLETLGFRHVYDFVPGKEAWFGAGLPAEGMDANVPQIGGVAETDVPTAALGEAIGEVRERVERSAWDRCLVVNQVGVVLGMLTSKELRGDSEGPVEDAMREGPSTFRPSVSVGEMLDYMKRHDLTAAPVTTHLGELIGVVRRERLEAITQGKGQTRDRRGKA
jgi:CBS domain-containing protein